MLSLKEDTMLGNIPSHWQVRPLRELVKENQAGDWGAEGGPHMVDVLRSTNLTRRGHLNLSDVARRSLPPQKAARLELRQNDILLERSGGGPDQPVGRVGFVSKHMPGSAFSNFLHLLRPDPSEINPLYLKWILWRVNQTKRILRLEQQTTQLRNLNFRDYMSMPLPVPPPAEQEAIAQVLDAADEAIERTRAEMKQVERLERGILTDLLSRGLGESGVLRNEDDHITTPIGKLPAAWELRRVGNEFDLQNGFTLNEARRPVYRKRRYLRVANVQRDALKLADIAELEAKDQEFALRELQVDDLLVVEGHADRMQIGRCARVTPEVAGMAFQNHLFRLRSRGRVNPYFGAIWLNSTYAQRYWNGQCATSSGLNTINQRMLKNMIIPVPPPREQEHIVQIVQGVRTAKEALKTKLTAQESLKAGLLHDLLTGRVRVGVTTSPTTSV